MLSFKKPDFLSYAEHKTIWKKQFIFYRLNLKLRVLISLTDVNITKVLKSVAI